MVDQAGSEKSWEFTFICVNTETNWMRNHTLFVTDCILWGFVKKANILQLTYLTLEEKKSMPCLLQLAKYNRVEGQRYRDTERQTEI